MRIKKFVDMAYERGLIVYSRRTRDGLAGDHILVCPIVDNDHIDRNHHGAGCDLSRIHTIYSPCK
jgi:hypothetical protein